jgi:integrase
LNDLHKGIAVDPVKVTLGQWLDQWLADKAPDLTARSIEVYREVIDRIVPVPGATPLQKLKPAAVQSWLGRLRSSGGKRGEGLSGQTCSQALGLLRGALDAAVRLEVLSRNPALAATATK